MDRVISLAIVAIGALSVLMPNAALPADGMASWMRLIRKGETIGFASTQVVPDGDNLRITHEVRIGLPGGQSVSGLTSVTYALKPATETTSASFVSERGPDRKTSTLTFHPDRIAEEMATRIAGTSTTKTFEHEREAGEFVHLWSLPQIAPMLLPEAGEVPVLFPEFPNSHKESALGKPGAIDGNYYLLTRSPEDSTGVVRFNVTATRAGQGRRCVMTLDAQGNLLTIEAGSAIKVEPATEADAEAWFGDRAGE